MYPSFRALCDKRRSVRSFQPEPISGGAIEQILEAVRTAPSAGNLQAYEVVVVRDAAVKNRLAVAAYGQDFVRQAPAVLAFLGLPSVSSQRYGSRGVRLYAVQDATIACTYAMMAATALGLATTWVGAYDDDAVKTALGITDDRIPIALLPVGLGAESPAATPRRPLAGLAWEL
jgi:nitroreductase